MPQHVLDHFHLHPSGEREGGGAVTQVMQPDRWQPGLANQEDDTGSVGRTQLTDLSMLWPNLTTPLSPSLNTNRTNQPTDQRPTLAPPHPMPPPDVLYRRR